MDNNTTEYVSTIQALKAENYDIIVNIQNFQARLRENDQRIIQLGTALAQIEQAAAEDAAKQEQYKRDHAVDKAATEE